MKDLLWLAQRGRKKAVKGHGTNQLTLQLPAGQRLPRIDQNPVVHTVDAFASNPAISLSRELEERLKI
jgi:hypothetical protein